MVAVSQEIFGVVHKLLWNYFLDQHVLIYNSIKAEVWGACTCCQLRLVRIDNQKQTSIVSHVLEKFDTFIHYQISDKENELRIQKLMSEKNELERLKVPNINPTTEKCRLKQRPFPYLPLQKAPPQSLLIWERSSHSNHGNNPYTIPNRSLSMLLFANAESLKFQKQTS